MQPSRVTTKSSRRQFLEGVGLVLVTVIIWGAFLPISKAAIQAIDLYWLNTLRFGLVVPLFCGLLWWREGLSAFRFDGRFVVVLIYSMLGYALYTNLVYEGAQLTSAAHGAALLALSPLWFAVYQWANTGRAPSATTLACVVVIVVGEVLVVTRGNLEALGNSASGRRELLGSVMIVVSSIAWVGYSTGTHHLREWSPLRYNTLTCVVGWLTGLVTTLTATATGHARMPSLSALESVLPQFLFLALLVSFVSFITWNSAVRLLGPLNAGLFSPFSPVITFGIALAGGASFTALEIVGAAFVLGALITNNLAARYGRHDSRHASMPRDIGLSARESPSPSAIDVG